MIPTVPITTLDDAALITDYIRTLYENQFNSNKACYFCVHAKKQCSNRALQMEDLLANQEISIDFAV